MSEPYRKCPEDALSGEGRIEATAVWLMGDPGGRFLTQESQHGEGREDRMMREEDEAGQGAA